MKTGNEEDPLWIYPIDTMESRDIGEKRGLEEIHMLLDNTALC